MKILIACEFSGITRQAFAEKDHDVWSCDLKPTEIEGQHFIGDVRPLLSEPWDLIIASPPTDPELIMAIWDAPCERIAIDNPPGRINRFLGQPAQTLNPWMFNDPNLNVACLWLKNLPFIEPENKAGMVNRIIRPKRGSAIDPRDALRMSVSVAKAMAKAWG
jgi:hypothetical protein